MQSYFYYVIIPNMVFILKLTHNHRDASGCGYVVPSGLVGMLGCGSDYTLVFAGTQHKQQQSISLQYDEYLLAYLCQGYRYFCRDRKWFM